MSKSVSSDSERGDVANLLPMQYGVVAKPRDMVEGVILLLPNLIPALDQKLPENISND
jgi:hypothetical protein